MFSFFMMRFHQCFSRLGMALRLCCEKKSNIKLYRYYFYYECVLLSSIYIGPPAWYKTHTMLPLLSYSKHLLLQEGLVLYFFHCICIYIILLNILLINSED